MTAFSVERRRGVGTLDKGGGNKGSVRARMLRNHTRGSLTRGAARRKKARPVGQRAGVARLAWGSAEGLVDSGFSFTRPGWPWFSLWSRTRSA